MNTLREVTLDNLINLYEGIVVQDRHLLELFDKYKDGEMGDCKRRSLKQDSMILGALKCAKANGFLGEE